MTGEQSLRRSDPERVDDKRTIFGWTMYDWANSAVATTMLGAVLPAYFQTVIVGDDGTEFLGRTWSGEGLYGLVAGTGPLILFLLVPVLGAIADYSGSKLAFLRAAALIGSITCAGFIWVGEGDVALSIALVLAIQICFTGGNVFYDAFLPDISTDDTVDTVSARGYATGYLGGASISPWVSSSSSSRATPRWPHGSSSPPLRCGGVVSPWSACHVLPVSRSRVPA